jgi:hypothetical protein
LPEGFSDKSRLELYTEFHPDTPQPQVTRRFLRRESDPLVRAAMVEPDWVDTSLDFGEMKVGLGKAFSLGKPTAGAHLPVGKRWVITEGRPVLIEAVEFKVLEPLLAGLQALNENLADPVALVLNAPGHIGRTITEPRFTRPVPQELLGQEVQLAQQLLQGPAVVIDYELQGTTNQFIFQSDTTYLVTGPFVVTYPTIEGGTVVKLTKGASASIEVPIGGGVNCQTAPYRPAIFTAKDDNSVGETVPGSTGNPTTNYYADTVLKLHDADHFLSHLRIAHARVGISLDDGSVTVRHGQFVHCQQAVALSWCAAYLQNALLHGVSNVFAGQNFRASSAEHLTVHGCATFSDDANTASPIGLTNCLHWHPIGSKKPA